MQTHTQSKSAEGSLSLINHAAGSDSLQFITFKLDDAEYGVDIMAVREIKGWTETTTIPKAPDYVRGVINLRGIIVPIFDLRSRFSMGLTEPTQMHVVIIVQTGQKTVGLLVDAVSDIITVESGAVRPVPDLGLASGDHFLEGLISLDQRMVTLVSLNGLFAELTPESAFDTPPPPSSEASPQVSKH